MRELIAAAFDMQAFYRPDTKQATVVLTITDATPGIITALLADSRTDHDTAATSPNTFADIPDSVMARETQSSGRVSLRRRLFRRMRSINLRDHEN
jgi:hypothetical protein